MDDKLSVRLANEQDFQDILEVSEGIYDGKDYLPFVFHQWLKTPGKYMFVGELHGKIIAFQTANVIDGGLTIFHQSLRISQEYRDKGYSYQMMTEVVNQVRRVTPTASRERYMTHESIQKMKRFSQRLGYECVMKKLFSSFQIYEQMVVDNRGIYSDRKELHELKVQDAVELVLEQRRFDHVIPKNIMVVFREPHELMPANTDRIFKESDKIFTDLAIDKLRQGLTPTSFSHGRLVNSVKLQTWICNIYATEKDLFKAHLIQHLMAAIEQREKTGRKTGLEVLRSPDLDFNAREVFIEVDLKEDDTDCVMCYEKTI